MTKKGAVGYFSPEARKQAMLTRRANLMARLRRQFGEMTERDLQVWRQARQNGYSMGYCRGLKAAKARRIARGEAA